MKKLLLAILIVIIGFPMFAQEVRFPSAVLSAGGNYDYESSIGLARWRIGQIHVITLPEELSTKVNDEIQDLSKQNWIVSVYPNPVEDFLYLEFKLPETKEFLLKITDAAGRVVFVQEARTFINGSIVEINMSRYSPALYLIQISSPDMKFLQVYRIQKIN